MSIFPPQIGITNPFVTITPAPFPNYYTTPVFGALPPAKAYQVAGANPSTSIAKDAPGSGVDQLVAPGIRLWMVLAMILACFTAMTIAICCIMKIRIPRSKREIERDRNIRMKIQRRHTRQMAMMSSSLQRSDINNEEMLPIGKNVVVMQTGRGLSRDSTFVSILSDSVQDEVSEQTELLSRTKSRSDIIEQQLRDSMRSSGSFTRSVGGSPRIIKEATV